MAKRYHIKETLRDAADVAARLLRHKPARTDKLPKSGGVYLVRHDRDGIIYIGITNNLKHRIGAQHLSSSKQEGSSSFRKSAAKKYGRRIGKDIQRWMHEHCTFATISIDDQDMVRLVEQVLIVTLKRAGEPLLNKK